MSTATQSLRPVVDRLRRGWRVSPMPGFLAWWGGELRALLPVRWRGWFGSGADWRVLQHEGSRWMLRRPGRSEVLASWDDDLDAVTDAVRMDDVLAPDRQGQPPALVAALQQIAPEDRRLALLLLPRVVLRRVLALPLAARDNLQQVMAFELDRQTPFSAAQVYFAARELSTPAAAGRFNAELAVVTRDTLDPLLARLHARDIPVDAVDMAVTDDRLGINFLPAQQTPHRAHPRRRLNLALAGACVLLLVLGLGEWLHNRQDALTRMQAEVEAMRGEAQQVAALRQQLQDNAGAAGFLAQRKKNTVGMLSLLQEATARFPESAWLERFSVDNTGQIGFQGQSQQAAKLLDALKDSPLITDASFQGSIQPDPTTGKERFYLTARVKQPAAGKPAKAAAPAPGGDNAP